MNSGRVQTSALGTDVVRGSGVRHHSWVKVKVHNYVCRKCGARKVNVEKNPGHWVAEWHTPDGKVRELPLAPPCVEGFETAARLVWLDRWQSEQPKSKGAEVTA